MGVSPTQHVQVFPIAKTTLSSGKHPYMATLQRQDTNEISKDLREPRISRPAKHPTSFEKGSLVDTYA